MLFYVIRQGGEPIVSHPTLDGLLQLLRKLYEVMSEDAVIWQGGRVVAVCQAGVGILHVAERRPDPLPISGTN